MAVIVLFALGLLASCELPPERIKETLFVFGSESTIEIVGVPAPVAQKALAEIAEDLQHLHQEWHAWEPSGVTALNVSLANGETVALSPTLRALIERSLGLAAITGGLFDPSVGSLMKLWGFHTSDFPIITPAPNREQIETWRASSARYTDLLLTDAGLQSRNPNVQLDFGAIAEGVATDRIVEILKRHGIHRALITLGGDLYAMGEAETRQWRAGLRDPFNLGGQPLATVELVDGEALYSSGSYNRYRESPSGSRWPHVVDPRTGLPVQGIVGVNVLHPDPVIADVASTALMVAGEAGFESLLRRMGVRCALLLTDSNELMMTAAMAERVTLLRDPLRLGPLVGTRGPCSEPEPETDDGESSIEKDVMRHANQR